MDFPYYVFAGEQNASAVRRAEEGAGNFIQVRGGAICEAERNFSCALASRGSTRAGTFQVGKRLSARPSDRT
jgi:hypothetical protein